MNDESQHDLIDSFGEFASAWDFTSAPALIFLLLAGAYLVGTLRLYLRSQADSEFWGKLAANVVGFTLVAVALVGPLDYYSDELFAAHMSQHIVIAMFAAPLLLIAKPLPSYMWSLPRWLRIGAGTALTETAISIRFLRLLTRPVVALPVFMGTLYAWHFPPAYNASLQNEWLHLGMHFTMFVSAVLFWWPIVGPPPIRTHLSHPQRIVYLLFAVTPTALMAAVITLSNSVIFDHYLDSPGHFQWSPEEDQRTGGLLMWIPGNFVYLLTMTVLFFKWFGEEEIKTSRLVAARPVGKTQQSPSLRPPKSEDDN